MVMKKHPPPALPRRRSRAQRPDGFAPVTLQKLLKRECFLFEKPREEAEVSSTKQQPEEERSAEARLGTAARLAGGNAITAPATNPR